MDPFLDPAAPLIAEEGGAWSVPATGRPPLAPPGQKGKEGSDARPAAAPFDYAATPVESGRTLVEASAGTGKTFALAGLVLRLVLDPSAGSGQAPDMLRGADGWPDLRRLLVVTFTVAATEELKTRIRDALRTALRVARREAEADDLTRPLTPLLARDDAEARLLAALDRVDEAGIFTIHGFCKRVLEQAAFESGTPFAMEFVEDAGALRRRASADAWARLVHGAPWAAALAVRLGWTPDALARHYDAVTRFPNTEILPPAPPLADAVGDVRRAAEAVCAVWEADEVQALLDGLVWTSKAAFDSERLDEVAARVATCGDDPDAIEAARWFTPAALAEALHGSRKVNRERMPEIAAHPALAACAALDAAVEALGLALVHAFTEAVAERLAANKERSGVLTFDDLLTRLHDALHDEATGAALAAGIRRQFAVALVDEFQDTDPVQYAIFKTAFDGGPLFFVGDPKQAIYAFRGADVHAYLRAQREADRRYTLGTNWRSAAPLVRAVNALFGAPARPFLYDEIGFLAAAAHREAPRLADGGKKPLVWWAIPPNENDQRQPKGEAREACLRAVVRETRRLLAEATLDGEALQPGDVAVLVRSNTQAQEMQTALRQAGVSAVVSRAGDIRETREMVDVEILLHAVARPDDAGALRAALATELWGWTAAEIARLDDAPDEVDALRRTLRDLQRDWRRHGILRVLARFSEEQNVAARLLAYPDGERRMTNLRHVVELLHETERAADRSPDGLLHWLRHRHEQQLGAREKSELRLERDADAVQITTVHNAKGLEYEVVFLPYLWDVHAKDYDADFTGERPPLVHVEGGRVVYDLGSAQHDTHKKRREVERLAEFLRLAYVGLTRAKERCYVAWGAANQAHLSALGYLLDGHAAESDEAAAHVERARIKAKAADPFASLSELVLAHPDLMTIEEVPDGPIPAPLAQPESGSEEGQSSARVLPEEAARRTQSHWRTHSFSAWVAAGRRSNDDTTVGALAASDEPEDDTRRDGAAETGLHAFAAGTAPGTCLHEVLQHARFHDLESEETTRHNEALVRRALERHGLADGRRHRAFLDPHAEVLALVRRLARTSLLDDARLGDCLPGHRAAEWRFVFPVGRVAPGALAEAFRAHAAPPFDGDYAERLAGLSPDAVDGFMTGVADLVAHHEGRWWVLDWKSNRLGPDAGAYAEDALIEAMRTHHYGLQLHLYTLGLHRFLRARLGDGYDYDRDVGGGVYVFLRGLADDQPEAGLLRHRPPLALIDALDQFLGADA